MSNITEDKIKKALNQVKNGRALGKDDINKEMIRGNPNTPERR